jgi:phosphoenolpyruvate phosphomutase
MCDGRFGVRNKLKTLLKGPDVAIVGGAHDAISARLVEEAGFDAVWLSSLGVSAAQKAIPDLNLVTMTEMLEVARHIVARVTIPLIADCENGYGNSINVVYMIEEFERSGISAACIEDNEHPKKNSFYEMARSLVSIEEMMTKIRSAVETRRSTDFLLIARTEALIAGHGVREAAVRVQAYAEAGADAVVVHSKSWAPLEEFTVAWSGEIPLVVIPTMFAEVGVEKLATAGFKMIIYANQALRASIKAMGEVLRSIVRTGGCDHLNGEVASLKEVERLVSLESLSGGSRKMPSHRRKASVRR